MICALTLTACASPSYYWQAASGHLALMQGRQAVDAILDDPDRDEALRGQLELTREILEFAQDQLDLPRGNSYETLVEIGGPVAWNVMATPEFSLQPKQWCFLVAGCVAYRGYFDRQKALAFADKLEQRGLDVAVLPVAAYSTLGWFEDPLLDTMLEQDSAQLAGTLFHELAHQRLYVRDDTMFNEAYASFVEAAGVERWLVSRQSGQDELRRWQEREAAGDDFNRLMHDARQEFTALYDADYSDNLIRAEKARRFAQLRQRYDRLVHEIWGGQSYFSGWMGEDLNNAHLVAIGAYAGGRCAFDSLLRSAEGEFEAFHELARELAERPREQRRAWLNQSCPAVAPAPEL